MANPTLGLFFWHEDQGGDGRYHSVDNHVFCVCCPKGIQRPVELEPYSTMKFGFAPPEGFCPETRERINDHVSAAEVVKSGTGEHHHIFEGPTDGGTCRRCGRTYLELYRAGKLYNAAGIPINKVDRDLKSILDAMKREPPLGPEEVRTNLPLTPITLNPTPFANGKLTDAELILLSSGDWHGWPGDLPRAVIQAMATELYATRCRTKAERYKQKAIERCRYAVTNAIAELMVKLDREDPPKERPTYVHTRADGPYNPCPICAELQTPAERAAVAADRAACERDSHDAVADHYKPPAPGTCRRCSECQGMEHHWMENDGGDNPVFDEKTPWFMCKHCAATCHEVDDDEGFPIPDGNVIWPEEKR